LFKNSFSVVLLASRLAALPSCHLCICREEPALYFVRCFSNLFLCKCRQFLVIVLHIKPANDGIPAFDIDINIGKCFEGFYTYSFSCSKHASVIQSRAANRQNHNRLWINISTPNKQIFYKLLFFMKKCFLQGLQLSMVFLFLFERISNSSSVSLLLIWVHPFFDNNVVISYARTVLDNWEYEGHFLSLSVHWAQKQENSWTKPPDRIFWENSQFSFASTLSLSLILNSILQIFKRFKPSDKPSHLNPWTSVLPLCAEFPRHIYIVIKPGVKYERLCIHFLFKNQSEYGRR